MDITLGGVLILTVGLISLSSVIATFLGRTGRYGMNSLIMILAFTGIVVVINFISFENHKRSDVTATNQFSLAQGTRQLLKELDEPVRATAFYVEDPNAGPNPDQSYQGLLARRAQVEETLREFEAARSSKFSFRFVDPALQPEIVRNYFGSLPTPLIQETIVVEGLDSALIHVVQPSDIDYSELEQDLYSSILVVSNQDQKTIYFLSGHGELSDIGPMLHESWNLKRSSSPGIATVWIDEQYETALAAGAQGGKILGAGGGGFLMLFTEPDCQDAVEEALKPMKMIRPKFDTGGSRITYFEPSRTR